jgi:hypothetical protein
MRFLLSSTILLFVFLLSQSSCQSKKEKLVKVIASYEQSSELNGFLHIEQAEKVLYSGALHNEAFQSPVNKETSIYLASLTKLFTEIAVLRLWQKGDVQLDSSISKYRKGLHASFAKRITIRQLLEMQSGLPKELNPEAPLSGVQYNSSMMAGPFLDSIKDTPLSYEPGTKEMYSNLNYWILGAVLEEISNSSLAQVFNEEIFHPLGMLHSGLEIAPSSVSSAYCFRNGQWIPDTNDYAYRYASGGSFSSVSDLLLLAKAIKDTNFLSTNARSILSNSSGRIAIYGSLPGVSNVFLLDFSSNFLLIALNNVGLKDLEVISQLQQEVEGVLEIERAPSSKRKVTVQKIDALNDSIPLEAGLKKWALAIETGSEEQIFQTINACAIEGSMHRNEPQWKELSLLSEKLGSFTVKGFRWVRNEKPSGIEIWIASDTKGQLALRWIPAASDSNKLENLFVMPNDMEWMGDNY